MVKSLTTQQRLRAAWAGVGLRIIGDRDGAAFCLRSAFSGQWEGGDQSRARNRPGRRLTAQDTDLNFGTRESLISEARSLEQTFPIARHIRNKFADYCVGKIKIKWNTGSPEIDRLYEANWKSFKSRADVIGVHAFPKLTKLAVGSMICDGDFFAQLVNTDNYLQIRGIEADRVSSSGNFNADLYNGDGPTMVGGIGLDANGRPITLRVWNRTIYGTFQTQQELSKPDWLHLFNSKRHDGIRGVTAYHAVQNAMRDFKEGSQAEMTAIKRNSKLALLRKVITGQAPVVNLFGGEGKADDSPTGITMTEINDGVDEYLFPNEDVTPHEFERPGNQWIPFMEFIIRQIAIGVDLPFSVVWHMAGMGKPAILADLQAAQRTFDSVMDEVEWKWIRPIVAIETSYAVKAKRLAFHPNWDRFLVGRPPPITIDAGRDSIAGLNENKMGLRTLKTWFFETEQDWEEETEQAFVEEKFRQDMGVKYDVNPDRVRVLFPNGNPGVDVPEDDQAELGTDDLETGETETPPVKPKQKKQKVAA